MLLLSRGFSTEVPIKDIMLSAELAGGNWNSDTLYVTNSFEYYGGCASTECNLEISRLPSIEYTIQFIKRSSGSTANRWEANCVTQSTEKGHSVCKSLMGQGLRYVDGDL